MSRGGRCGPEGETSSSSSSSSSSVRRCIPLGAASGGLGRASRRFSRQQLHPATTVLFQLVHRHRGRSRASRRAGGSLRSGSRSGGGGSPSSQAGVGGVPSTTSAAAAADVRASFTRGRRARGPSAPPPPPPPAPVKGVVDSAAEAGRGARMGVGVVASAAAAVQPSSRRPRRVAIS